MGGQKVIGAMTGLGTVFVVGIAANATSSTILGEPTGAWILGIIALVANLAVAGAAVWSSHRANKIAKDANRIANEGIEEHRRIAARAREREINDALVRELEESVTAMRRLSSDTPLEPSPSLTTPEAISETYNRLMDTLGAMQAYGAYMGRASELSRRLEERGFDIQMRGGRDAVFRNHDFEENDSQIETLHGIVETLGELRAEGRTPSRDERRDIERDYESVREYWTARWFNLPRFGHTRED